MDELGGNFADEATEMAPETSASTSTELRKRRSTRIVQAVPLLVTGVDALGRPFTERTSTLIINCHGCRYQSKHYVLKNMWVTAEVPHPETGRPPRTVRGRVAWIQRPRTVRQLFQVALELEVPGNVWGIAFPPEDWFAFPEATEIATKFEGSGDIVQPQLPAPELEFSAQLNDTEPSPVSGADNIRLFPSPASTTDASLQLARQVARLVADAKQQIQAAAREAASQAVLAERKVSFEQWEQKFAAARAELAKEAVRGIERIQEESDAWTRAANAAAVEALKNELPRWLAPQLEQLTRELTTQLAQEGAVQRNNHAQQLKSTSETLQELCQQAEGAAARLKSQAEQTEAQISERAEAAAHAVEEVARQREETAGSERESLRAAANEIQAQVLSEFSSTQSSWHLHLSSELEAAEARWLTMVEATLGSAGERAAAGFNEQARGRMAQLQEELVRHATALRESTAGAVTESEQRLAALRSSVEEQSQRLEAAAARANESTDRLEQFAPRLENAQRQALEGFASQLDDVLSLHRNELHRRSESLFEEIKTRIRGAFEEASAQAVTQFEQRIDGMVEPHVSRTEQAIHRLAGGRALLDAALTLQQDRIRNSADEAFAEAMGRFRENLGSVEQLLHESAETITGRHLTELESKTSDLKHQAIEELFKSAEWYEKRTQTQIQNLSDKTTEQAGNQMREKAGEISSVFAGELDNASRNFVRHTQTQMEEVVHDSFERARALFREASETTEAAFTDEIQRTARQELAGFSEELQRATEQTRAQCDAGRVALAEKVTAEQEDFLRRFQAGMSSAIEAGVAEAQHRVQEGFGPLLDSWKAMTDAHQGELQGVYAQMGGQAAEKYRNRLENLSNQWMLATVTSLDHQSRDAVANMANTAQEKLRETCAEVLASMGDTLREKLRQIASSFALPTEPPARATSANSVG
jgi:hypothetical protein